MNVVKLIAIYGGLVAVLALAHDTQFAGVLYFGAAMSGVVLLNTQTKPEEDPDSLSSYNMDTYT